MVDKMRAQKAEIRRLGKEKEELRRRMIKRDEEFHQRRIAKNAQSQAESTNRIQQLIKEVQVVSEEVENSQSPRKIEGSGEGGVLTQKDLRKIK